MTKKFTLLLTLLAIAACTTPEHHQDPSLDGGDITDAGNDASDSDSSVVSDSGIIKPDSSTQDPDSGVAVTDSGTNPTDSSVQDPDSGTTPRTDGCPQDAPLPLTRVQVTPVAGQEAQVLGAIIQGSNSGPTTDFVDLVTVTQTVQPINVSNTKLYRYLRIYAPEGSQGSISELKFWNGQTPITGVAFGTASGGTPGAAFDNDTATFFTPTDAGGGYVGLDVSGNYLASPVIFTASSTDTTAPITVSLSTASTGAAIHYTVDGTVPTATATVYSTPVSVPVGITQIRAIVVLECGFNSAVSSKSYVIGGTTPTTGALNTYVIGNSLTDTVNAFLKPIADSTGIDSGYARWTIPGTSILYSYQNQSSGFISDGFTNQLCADEGAAGPACVANNVFAKFVTQNTIDVMSVQPYNDYYVCTQNCDFAANPDQGGAAALMFNAALTTSPNLQGYIYQQWPGQTSWPLNSGYSYLGSSWKASITATTWEQSVEVSRQYFEFFRDTIDPQVNGKPLLIVPAGTAMLALKQAVDSGQVPGVTNFFTTMFADDEHLTVVGQYYVSLVFYSTFYKQTPEDRVTSAGSTLTAAQAKVFQNLAWTTVSGYASSGVAQ